MSEADPSDYDGGTAGGIRDDMTARSQLDPIVPAEAVELYFSHRQPDLSEKTLQNQRYRLQSFVEWCDENGVDNLNDLTGRDIYRFRSARLNDGVAKVTLTGVLQTLRVFLEFAAAIDAVPEGMRERVQLPETNPQEEASDEILEETFGGRAVVTTNPVTGAPSVTAVDTPVPDGETRRIHVLGHGTEAATTLARLVTAGCRCSAGVLPTGSVAAETADALDVEAVTTPAFRTAEDASVSSHRDRPFRGEHHVLDDAPQKYLRDPRSVSSTHDDLVDTSLVCRSDDLSGDTAVVDTRSTGSTFPCRYSAASTAESLSENFTPSARLNSSGEATYSTVASTSSAALGRLATCFAWCIARFSSVSTGTSALYITVVSSTCGEI